MAWRLLGPRWTKTRRTAAPAPAVAAPEVLTAAALVTSAVKAGQRVLVPTYENWQRELWTYFEEVGEFSTTVSWRSGMMSRVRLRAARMKPDADEPEIVDSGPAAELVNELFGGIIGQAEGMRTMTTLLDVCAESWVVGEVVGSQKTWQVRSTDEIRAGRSRDSEYEIVDDERSSLGRLIWRPLAADHMVTRIWNPHPRVRHLPHAPAKAARSALRELSLVNRHIQVQYLSRLASAGIIVLPDEITFPVRPEFEDAPDPFIAEWIETAKQAIQTPGTAAAAVPIPMRLPGEYVDKVKHIDFTLKLDERIIEKRDSARHQLATQLNVPADLLFDTSKVNHWGLWQLEDVAIKAYIAPDAEVICGGLTTGYLTPRLRARGVADWADWIVWYDTSEIQVRPDRSANAIKAYQSLEISGKALRRETGFDEDDAPTDDELTQMALRRLAVNPQVGFLALQGLTGFQPLGGAAPAPGAETPPNKVAPEPRPVEHVDPGAPPANKDEEPKAPGKRLNGSVRDALTVLQANTDHVMEFGVSGWKLRHPLLCQPAVFSCPFTHVTSRGVTAHPGTSGSYECRLSDTGDLVIGARVFTREADTLEGTPRKVNGVRHG